MRLHLTARQLSCSSLRHNLYGRTTVTIQSWLCDAYDMLASQETRQHFAQFTNHNHVKMMKRPMKKLMTRILGTCAAGLLAVPAFAQQTNVDGAFSLQGRLTTGTGNEAVADAQHTLTINIFEAGTNTSIATETDQVTTVDGIFSTMIGDNSDIEFDAGMEYEIGVSVNGGAELSPRIMIGDAPSAMVADMAAMAEVAADAMAIGGFAVSENGTIGPNQLVTTDAQGRLNSELFGNSVVTSINGSTGSVNLNVNGSGVSLDDDGNGNLTLNISGSGGGGGDFTLPFTGTNASANGSTAFSLTSTGAGSAATFINTSTGSALDITGQGSAMAALNVENTAGTAIDVTANSANDAALNIQNMSTDASASLISGVNASSNNVFNVAADGRTTINATTGDALNVMTDDASGAALRLQNTASGSTNMVLDIVDASGSSTFMVAESGTTTIDATGGEALNLTSDGSTTLMLENTASSNGMLIDAVDASSNSVFMVAANGSTTIDATGAEALSLASDASSTLTLENSATTGMLLEGLDASSNTIFSIGANGSTTIDATGAEALNLASDASTTLMLENSAASNGMLIDAMDANGTSVFEVGANGRTEITSSVEDALEVSTSAQGGTALRVVGGLELPQAVGTGTLNAGSLTTTINNANVRANSVVMLTINSAANVLNGLRVSAVGNGSFTVSLLDTTLGALNGNVSFNYLIINQ